GAESTLSRIVRMVESAQAKKAPIQRSAPRRAVERLPFHVWMALAQAGPHMRPEGDEQAIL
uniref:hypothetical protein n=1 Tax=Hydrogenophaga sp. TaxID=1904254 RepID=UPI003F72FF54